MSNPQNAVQDPFLNALRKQKMSVTVFLLNGVKLQGIVSGFDQFSLMLRREGVGQLVYKHAIATIVPSQAISLAGEEGDE